jgi:regulator of sigma E protease
MDLLIFLIVLSILVVVHEWGHFMMARRVGIKVEKFSIGFGPKLISRILGGTEYMLCLIPLGGFVKLAGDERAQCKGKPEEFFSHSVGHRACVIAMGPIVNFIFAYICFYAIFVTGFPMLPATVGKVMTGYPAEMAGLREGDQILQIDSVTPKSWEDVQTYITRSQQPSLRIRLLRGQEQIEKIVIPQEKSIPNIFGQEDRVRVIGIQPKAEVIFLKYSWQESFSKAFDQIVGIITLTFRALFHVFTGTMSAKDAFAGPIRIFDVIREAAAMGLASLIYIMGIISTSLAIFNLFPVPVLDGGHLFLLVLEKVRKRPLPINVEEGLTKVGLSLLMCLMLFVLYNDMLQVGWVEHIKGFVQSFKQ